MGVIAVDPETWRQCRIGLGQGIQPANHIVLSGSPGKNSRCDRLHRGARRYACRAVVTGADDEAGPSVSTLPSERHPTTALPAFVLGALDVDDAVAVGQHVVACARCRADVGTFVQSIALPPRAGHVSALPRPEVKRRLMARIVADQAVAPDPAPRQGMVARLWRRVRLAAAAVLASGRLLIQRWRDGSRGERPDALR